MAECVLDHVALVVRSLDAVLPSLIGRGWVAETAREYPTEGTREAYVREEAFVRRAAGAATAAAGPVPAGHSPSGRLLLVEPVGPGPYARALAERGPGLHHLGLVTADLSAFAARLAKSGWFVHPYSLRAGSRLRDLWLFRPGVPTLIEIFEGSAAGGLIGPVQRIVLPAAEGLRPLLTALSCEAIQETGGAGDRVVLLRTSKGELPVDELL